MHRTYQARGAALGMSLQEYLLAEIVHNANLRSPRTGRRGRGGHADRRTGGLCQSVFGRLYTPTAIPAEGLDR